MFYSYAFNFGWLIQDIAWFLASVASSWRCWEHKMAIGYFSMSLLAIAMRKSYFWAKRQFARTYAIPCQWHEACEVCLWHSLFPLQCWQADNRIEQSHFVLRRLLRTPRSWNPLFRPVGAFACSDVRHAFSFYTTPRRLLREAKWIGYVLALVPAAFFCEELPAVCARRQKNYHCLSILPFLDRDQTALSWYHI